MTRSSSSSRLRPAEALFEAWCAQHPEPAPAALEALCAQHPNHAEELRRLHDDRERGRELIERLAGAHADSGAPPIELPPADAGPTGPRHNAERYAFEGEIGRGGMGVVLRVRDRELGRPLAMKVAHAAGSDGSSARRRAERLGTEARMQARLDHPGILPVHELGLGPDGTLYFTMPLVQGSGLDEILAQHRAGSTEWTAPRIASVLLRVCEAMSYAHHQGIVHRDLKPSNVMVGSFGETYVTDWGLARLAGAPDERDLRIAEPGAEGSPLHTREGDVLGTPAYMPPEQAEGRLDEVDERADVYAVGAMLYELLAGGPPYGEKPPLRVLDAVRAGPPPPITKRAPEELVAVCERAMARDPDERYATAADLAGDLRAWLEGRVVRAHATGPAAELRKWIGRNRLEAVTAAGAMIAIIGGLALHTRTVSRAAEDLAASLYRTDVALATAALSSGDTGPLEDLLARAPETLRGWEWSYLARLADASRAVLRGEGNGFHRVAVSPDGSLAAAGDSVGIVSVWDPASAREFARFRAIRGPVRELAFDADSRTLWVDGDDRALLAFDAREGTLVAQGVAVDRTHANLKFDLDLDLAAAGSYDGIDELFSARSGTPLGVLEGVHEGGIEQTVFVPGGELAITSSRDGRIAVWSIADLSCVRSWHAHDSWVRRLALSPDARWIASGAGDGTAAVWALETGERIATLPVDIGGVFVLAWNRDGSRLASAGGPVIHVWDTETWRERARLVGHSSRAVDAVFAPDGTLVSIGLDDELHIFELGPAEARVPLPAHDGDVEGLVFLPGGERVASGGRDGFLVLRRFEDGVVLANSEPDVGQIYALALSPDGETIAVAGDEGRVALVDAEGFAPRGAFDHPNRPNDIAFLGTDALLLADTHGAITLRRLPGGELVWTQRSAEVQIVHMALDAPRDRVAVGAADGSVHLYRATTGELVARAKEGETGGKALAISPDGRMLAAGGRRRLQLFELPALRLVRSVDSMEHSSPLVYLPDGSRLLGGGFDGNLTVWDPKSVERIASFPGHREACSAMALSEDGQCLATGSSDDTLELWDARPPVSSRRSAPPR